MKSERDWAKLWTAGPPVRLSLQSCPLGPALKQSSEMQQGEEAWGPIYLISSRVRTSTGAGFWARNKPSYWDSKKKKTRDYQFHLDIFRSVWIIRDWIFPDHLDLDSSQDCPPPFTLSPRCCQLSPVPLCALPTSCSGHSGFYTLGSQTKTHLYLWWFTFHFSALGWPCTLLCVDIPISLLYLKPTSWRSSLMSLKDHLKFKSRAGSVCSCPEALRVLSWWDWCLWGMQGVLCDPTAMGWQRPLSRSLVAQKSFSSPGYLQPLSQVAQRSSGSFLWWHLNNQDSLISESLAWLYLRRLSPWEITLCDDSNTGLTAQVVKFSSSSLFWKSLKKFVFSITYLVEFISEANWVWVSLFKVVFDY